MTQQNEKATGGSFAAKRLTRLVAVQALYQASYDEEDLGTILKRCLSESDAILNDEESGGERIGEKPDAQLLSQITQGVTQHRAALEEILAGALSEKFSAGRMEILLKTILLAGVFELHHHAEIPAGVIISDYVDVTHAFFNTKEPGLVNAVLDRLAKALRS
ncbi:MAG TPA: transcription antitermination factor NusB [Rhodospirillaceae bacterium]|nr:transcription antitermination factor NusB [Rhodospirillaceae bacterium]